jgi:hypothetical protein
MTDFTIGVQIERSNKYGTEYVTVRVMRREPDASHPLNISWSPYTDEQCVESLELQGFVSDYGEYDFIAFGASYSSVFKVDTKRATAMLKTLQRIDRQTAKDEAREPGDVLISFCKAIRAQWCVYEVEHNGTWLRDSKWRFVSIAEGRNKLRAEIAAAREAMIARKAS